MTRWGLFDGYEHREYVHSLQEFLAVQIDAAVNPGNSGGPVVVDGKLVGVVMQNLADADSTSYAIPVSIVQHFLEDMKDGKIDGVPNLGIIYQSIENDSLRFKYKMKPNQTGVLINKVIPHSSVYANLFKDDILMEIEQHRIANDGTVEFRPFERTKFEYIIQNYQVGNEFHAKVFRDEKVVGVTLKLEKDEIFQVKRPQYDVLPEYYIFGGMVFSPLTINYLYTWGENWEQDAPPDLVNLAWFGVKTIEVEEYVAVIKILPDKINLGYHELLDFVILKVNGNPIKDFNNFIDIIENSKSHFVELETKLGNILVIERSMAVDRVNRILETYNIPSLKNIQ